MLFRKKMPRSCAYCTHGTKISNEQILCIKAGVVSEFYKCRRFRYDPCKRIPVKVKPLDISRYAKDDFTL